MTVTIVKRAPRRPAPAMPSGELLLDPPPEVPAAGGKGWTRMLMVLPAAAGAAAIGLMMGVQRGGPLTYVVAAMYGVALLGMIAMIATSTTGPGRRETMESRRQYLRHLAQLRAQVRNAIRQQREAMYHRHPDPRTLWTMVSSARLWERRRGDADFTVIRVAVGAQEVATRLVPPQTRPVELLEPVCAMALRRFVRTYSVVPDLPATVVLRDLSHVYLRGTHDAVHDLIRALIAQIATFHAPNDLRIGICVPDHHRPRWEWAKWLPHAQHPTRTDAVGPVRLVAAGLPTLEALLDDVLVDRPRFDPAGPPSGGPHVVVVLDGGSTAGSGYLLTEGGVAGVTILELSVPPPRLLDAGSVVLEIRADGSVVRTAMDGSTTVGRADALDQPQAEVLARELSPLRLSDEPHGDQAAVLHDRGLAELLEQDDPYHIDVDELWVSRSDRDRLRVPIGVGLDGGPIELDLKESAQGGMGPHGLLVGATGSGKSELLRTLVLALATTHPPEIVNFVLVDFRGGATFASLDRLPHTSALITNLGDEPAMVDHMFDALRGELTRRQELLLKPGNYASQRDYERARSTGVPLAPLPSLLLVIDEFSALFSSRPDVIDIVVQMGRAGRSLGVHLLLASQRLEEGWLRGLETHLFYRIGLRTFSSTESRALLGVPDAYELPRSPGHGYLRTGTEELVRLKAAYVSGAVRRKSPAAGLKLDNPVREFSTYYIAPLGDEQPASGPEAPLDAPDQRLVSDPLIEVLIRQLEGRGAAVRRLWPPPLDTAPTLGHTLPPVTAGPRRGVAIDTADAVSDDVTATAGHWAGPPGKARLLPAELPYQALPSARGALVPIGIAETDLRPVWLDFDAEPHVLVFGDMACGKSSFLRGLARSIAASNTPGEARLLLIDPRRSLLGCVDAAHTVGYGTSRQVTADLIRRVATGMRDRLPGPDVTPEMLPARRWWRGPQLYVLVDDYDLVAGAATNPLLPLLELLPRGRDIGLRLIVTRRIGGAARAMADPLIARVRELASPGLMMSGPREEGPLFDTIEPQILPPGRAWMTTRKHGSRLVQLAWTPPAG